MTTMTTTMALSRWSRSASEPIRGEAALASAAAACAAATHVFFVPRRRSRAAVARSSRDVSSFLKRAPYTWIGAALRLGGVEPLCLPSDGIGNSPVGC